MNVRISYERAGVGHPDFDRHDPNLFPQVWCASAGEWVVRIFPDGVRAIIHDPEHSRRHNNTVGSEATVRDDLPDTEEGQALRVAYVKHLMERDRT